LTSIAKWTQLKHNKQTTFFVAGTYQCYSAVVR